MRGTGRSCTSSVMVLARSQPGSRGARSAERRALLSSSPFQAGGRAGCRRCRQIRGETRRRARALPARRPAARPAAPPGTCRCCARPGTRSGAAARAGKPLSARRARRQRGRRPRARAPARQRQRARSSSSAGQTSLKQLGARTGSAAARLAVALVHGLQVGIQLARRVCGTLARLGTAAAPVRVVRDGSDPGALQRAHLLAVLVPARAGSARALRGRARTRHQDVPDGESGGKGSWSAGLGQQRRASTLRFTEPRANLQGVRA